MNSNTRFFCKQCFLSTGVAYVVLVKKACMIYETLWTRKWLADFHAGKTQRVSFDRCHNPDVIDVEIDWSVLEEKSPLRQWDLLKSSFSSKVDWGFYFV